MRSNLRVYTASDTWTKPEKLVAVDIVVRSAGGGGARVSNTSGAGGGGGGAVRTNRRLPASRLPGTVAVTVGAGGSPSQDGGTSAFGDFLAIPGGAAAQGTTPGMGGYSVLRGGFGGAAGQDGESVGDMLVDLLAGGGGGGAAGRSGGLSGKSAQFLGSDGLPLWWQWCQSGAGGRGGTASYAGGTGVFPAGGGGGGGLGVAGNGANGCVTVLEYLLD